MGKISRKKIRRVSKAINILVSVIMILQPVGTPGILGAFLLTNKAVAETADVSPADEGTETSQDNSVKTDDAAKDSAPDMSKDESGSQSGSNDSGSANDSGSTASNEQSAPDGGANIEVEDANPADSSANTETGTQLSDTTGVQENNTGVSSDASLASPATDANGGSPDGGAISSDAAVTETPAETPDETPAETPAALDPVLKENGDLNTFVAENVEADSVELDSIDPENTDQTAELATDKADYAPTDTVIITGTGFAAGKTYILKIASKDLPPVTHEAEVTADENGQFVYAYQLDGNYRPNYAVAVSDGDGNELAKTTFKDFQLIPPTLVVNKILVPSSDAGKFNLQIDGVTAGTGANVGNGGTTGVVVTTIGSHTVGETAGTLTNLADYDAVISGDCAPSGNITLTAGQNKVCTITNTRHGSVIAHKFEDNDLNGAQDSGDADLADWEMSLYSGSDCQAGNFMQSGITGTDGNYIFSNLTIGSYSVKETLQSGWQNTTPICQNATVTSGDTPTVNFGNQFAAPRLIIEKSNNKFPIDQHPGDDVTYTLAVTALDNDVNDVHVIDLSPNGFVYRSGSWTAHSSVRGDIKNSPTTEPIYNLSGDWSLGDMKKDEIVTLTYVADISISQESGLYPDLAWTQGVDAQNNEVLGAGTNSNFVQDAFVGTKVSVIRPLTVEPASVKIATNTETEHKNRKTVRKTVTLPATGASPWRLAVALAMLLAGAGFLMAGKRKKRR